MTASIDNEGPGIAVPEEFVPALSRLITDGGMITKDGYVPPAQPRAIRMIVISQTGELKVGFSVGVNGVTRIEPYEEFGMYCGIPYLRVWKGDVAVGEFCKHNIVGTYFEEPTR